MRLKPTFIASILSILVSSIADAHGKPVELPIYIYCQQSTGLDLTNDWMTHHLFVFEKNDRTKYGLLINGQYFRAESHAGGLIHPEPVWDLLADSGQATLAETEDPNGGSFVINAVGYNPSKDTNLPSYVVSGNIDVTSPSVTSSFQDTLLGSVQYYLRIYDSNCHVLSKDEALRVRRRWRHLALRRNDLDAPRRADERESDADMLRERWPRLRGHART